MPSCPCMQSLCTLTYRPIQRRRVYKIPVFKIPPRANSLKNKNFAMATARPGFLRIPEKKVHVVVLWGWLRL